jgi:hypothetical protein
MKTWKKLEAAIEAHKRGDEKQVRKILQSLTKKGRMEMSWHWDSFLTSVMVCNHHPGGGGLIQKWQMAEEAVCAEELPTYRASIVSEIQQVYDKMLDIWNVVEAAGMTGKIDFFEKKHLEEVREWIDRLRF